MHIKQITIEGFKSYKDQITPEPFSPKINVVVGANGSGKSNFFSAIRFVLDGCFNTGKADEKKKLLHEGTGQAVNHAYVEIVFDNSDGRLPTDNKEVRLRRTIGLKRDEFSLDRKTITKTEVQNLLESAGFSRANPYYVVQQGKIVHLSTMKDAQRLELLKEVGGTKTYEERRAESKKILDDTTRKLREIESVLADLDSKMKELDEERAELTKYQEADKQRRGIEYAIYDRELTAVKKQLEELAKQQEAADAAAAQVQQEADAARSKLLEVEEEAFRIRASLPDLRAQHAAAERAEQEAIQQHAARELDVAELQQRHTRALQQQAGTGTGTSEAASLQAQVTDTEQRLSEARIAAESTTQRLEALTHEKRDKELQLQALYQKQGAQAQFASKAARDTWLKGEVGKLRAALEESNRAVGDAQQRQEQLEKEVEDLHEAVRSKEAEVQRHQQDAATRQQQLKVLQEQRTALVADRRRLFREESQRTQSSNEARTLLQRQQRHMERAVPRDVNRGLNSVKRIVQEKGIQGVYGALLEVFQVDDKLMRAVEVTAGASLFHIVCDNEETALSITEELRKQQAGRATFMPLNRLRPPTITYPTDTDRAFPLLRKLKYTPEVAPAVQQVFARTLLCPDLDTAAEFARSTQLNCITLDGDEANRKGTLTGGYTGNLTLKLQAWKEFSAAAEAHAAAEEERKSIAAQLATLEQQSGPLESQLQKADAAYQYAKAAAADATKELHSLTTRLPTLEKQRTRTQQQSQQLLDKRNDLEKQIQALRAEMATEFGGQLSAKEQQTLQTLNMQVQQLGGEVSAVEAAHADAQALVAQLEEQLEGTLRGALREAMQQEDAGVLRTQLHDAQQALQTAAAALQAASTETTRLSELLVETEQRQGVLKEQLEGLRDALAKEAQLEQDEDGMRGDITTKVATARQKQSDYEKRIKDLGSLPRDVFDKYRNSGAKALHQLLAKVNKELKALGGVNQKALDQYNTFKEQRRDLELRRVENKKAETKINQLIETLDMHKDECIERTFKQVAKHFKDVFAELVPGGRGELVMQTSAQVRHADQENMGVDGAGDGGRLDKYVGVKVKVSFGTNETMLMKQLSGGQKTLTALTLIFAIQRCDPAPFYLFDEIDAALDPAYRTSVAKLLRKQADDPRNPAQFILTTFHPQFVQVADKVYGVSHQARVSNVCAILPKDALTFLSQDAANNPHAGSAGGGGGTQQRRAQQQYSGQPSGGGASTDMTGDDDDDGQEEG